MIDRTGRVIINPRMGMGVTDFQRLYMGEGRTPAEAQSFIHLNYPMEAKSFMDKQWQNLGIKDSPERFFANPANLQMLDGGTDTAIQRTNAAMGPTRFIAQAAPRMAPGMNAAAATIPGAGGNMAQLAMLGMAQQEEQAGRILEAAPQAQLRQVTSRSTPLPLSSMSDDDLRRSQTAGDNGFTRKFLARRSGITDYSQWLNKPLGDPNWLEKDDRYRSESDIKPYRPTNMGPLGAGYGRLDQNIFNDAEFQDLYAENPEQAAFAYQRLTGRDLKGDYDETMKLRKDNNDAGRRYAQRAIEQGAQKDPVTGQWLVWNVNEAPEDNNAMTQTTPRPFRQRVRATPDQAYWLDQHRTGLGLPDQSTPTFGTMEAKDILRASQKDPAGTLATKIKAEEQRMGGPLLPAEIAKIKHDVEMAAIAARGPENDGTMAQVHRGIERSFRAVTGQLDDAVVDRGNSPLADFYNEYLGSDMRKLPIIGSMMPRHIGNRTAPSPSQPAAKPKVMVVDSVDPITGARTQQRVIVDPSTGAILKRL